MRPNMHLTPSFFDYQSRMLKETKSLADNGAFAPIHIADMWREGLAHHEQIDLTRNIRRVRLTTRALPNEILFIYQGIFEAGRNVEMLLRVFAAANPKKHIVFLGFGLLEQVVKAWAEKHSKIHIHPVVSPGEVLALSSSANIGIHITGNTCLNHNYCLPNKAFEYLLSGLPSVLSDFPELSNLIKESGVSWTTPVSEEGVLKLVNSITRKQVERRRKAALKARRIYGWELEEKILTRAYRWAFPIGETT